jgi:hypothetical protein
METRNGLMVGGVATRATGDAEPLAALELVMGVAGRRRSRWAPTRPLTPQPSSWSAASRVSPRTWRRPSPRPEARVSTGAPPELEAAEILDDGSLEIEFDYQNSDEAILEAKRDTSAC